MGNLDKKALWNLAVRLDKGVLLNLATKETLSISDKVKKVSREGVLRENDSFFSIWRYEWKY